MKTSNLVGMIQQRSAAGANGGAAVSDEQEAPDTLDAEIAAAEKEASRLLNDLQSKSKKVSKAAFDKKVHGK